MLNNHLQKTIPHTLLELLSRYRISIPGIQRHYVQGANDPHAKVVRKNIIHDIFKGFTESRELHLDFIFGPIDTNGADTFIPVDGQQRLTTLWLLARYAVARLPKDNEQERQAHSEMLCILSRFEYADRRYASRFCKALTDASQNDDWATKKKPSIALSQCGILVPGWRQDSTVDAMLNTLDSIAEQWLDYPPDSFLEYLWDKVTFQLCMEHFHDDLYMKMNARGLPLTQWEKAKGHFAEKLEKGVDWSKRIEVLSNKFFEQMKIIPDDAFIALLGRVTYYVLTKRLVKSSPDELKTLANYNFSKSDSPNNLPYVPFEEFLFEKKVEESGKTNKSNVLALETNDVDILLRMMDYLLDKKDSINLPEWDGEKDKLLDAVFLPSNLNQRTLSLILFEYFSKFDAPSTEAFNNSLRLFWNVLNNVSSNDNNDNLVSVLKSAIDKATNSDLYQNKDLHFDSTAEQYREEEAKGFIYRKDETADGCTVDELWKAEAFLQGRIRMALLDLNNKNVISINHKRLQTICDIRKIWKESKEHSPERRKLIATVIMAMPYDDRGNKTFFDLYTNDKAIIELLASDYDKYLQHSLLDCIMKHGIDVSPKLVRTENPANFQNHFNGNPEKWIRDWQENLLWMFDNHPNEVWNHTVKKHAVFYLSQRNGAISQGRGLCKGDIPINDYRFDYFRDPIPPQWVKFCKDYCGSDTAIGITEGRDSGKYRVREGLGINVYFSSGQADIKAWNSNLERVYWKIVAYDASEQNFFEQICQRIAEAESTLKEDRK